jgi:hypothetical protein
LGTAGVEILRQIRETFEEKGWKSGFVRCEDSGARPLLVKSNDHCIAFFERYSYTGECWFELRDRAQGRVRTRGAEHTDPTTGDKATGKSRRPARDSRCSRPPDLQPAGSTRDAVTGAVRPLLRK